MGNGDDKAFERRTWHCVLDRNMRQLYLGRDQAEALRLGGEGCVMASAPRMGDAMVQAAWEAGKRFK